MPIIARGDGHPPLYFWFMHGWLKLGSSEFWMRFPSTIFFTMTVPVVYVMGRTISTPRAGVYAAFLFATAPFLIHYAQEARSYAMLAFFGSVALMSTALILARYDAGRPEFIGAGLRDLCSGRARHRKTERASAIRGDLIWLAYILSVVAAMLTHNTAVLLPVVTSLIFLVAIGVAPGFKRRHALNFAIAHLLVALLYRWYLPHLLEGVERIRRSFYVKSVNVQMVDRAFHAVYGNEYVPLVFLALLCLSVGALVAWHRTRQWRWMAFALIGWLGLPILELIAGVFYRPVFVGKTLIWSCGPFLLMCAVGISLLRTPLLRGLVLACLLLSNLYGVSAEYGNVEEPWNRVVDTVAQEASGRDAGIFCIDWVNASFNYYWRHHDRDIAMFGITDGEMRHFAVTARDNPAEWRSRVKEARDVESLFDDYERVWLIFNRDGGNRCDEEAIRSALATRGHLVDEQRF